MSRRKIAAGTLATAAGFAFPDTPALALVGILPMMSPCEVAGWLPWCPRRRNTKIARRIPKR